jgi:REP element-mobilizing transposase RayT
MEKFQNKYRIPSARASWWDYGNNAAYFITICTQNRVHYFGEIENQKMVLTELGKSAETCWYEIPNHFPFVQLGAFVVMPNHIHGIIIIDKPYNGNAYVETQNFASLQSEQSEQSEQFEQSEQSQTNQPKNKFGPQSQNLASIVRGYKIGVTKQSKIICPDFKWQTRFHDHIIRNDAEYQRINDYIETNPVNWENDKFFKSE